MIVADDTCDIGAAARSLAETLADAGARQLSHDLLVAVDNDIADGKPLKTLAIHDNRLFYGLLSLGDLP